MASKTWLITGTSRGFGRDWTRAALARGDRVAATARDLSTLDDIVAEHGDAVLPLQLDVTDRAACFETVRRAHERFGRIDILVNNAGYLHQGMIEELTEEEVRLQIDTNLLGPLWMTQATLPIMRGQRAGHIIQVSSVGGVMAFPPVGIYNASKWGLEGLSDALSQEIASFGIRVTLIEPGGFATDAVQSARYSEPLEDYKEIHEVMLEGQRKRRPKLGSSEASAQAVLEIVDADDPPLRVFFGGMWLENATKAYEARLALWREHQDLAVRAEGD